ncbi:MAG: site-specific recombinase [Candidatus Methanomethylophilaceae archaeon]|nr:site-specific recombinase [Candidatus Methanomethylophilaceae archaeon]
MRAALYTRVSTEDQAKEGYSLDAQMKRLEAYCQVREWEIGGKYRDEGCSGRDTDRPEYRRMFAESDCWDVLLVLKMDRIHRNSVNFTLMMDELRRHGKEFNSMQEKFDTTTAMGRFVMDIMQRIAQLESEQIGERVKVGMMQKAQFGTGPMGSGHPYGYVYSRGKLEVVEDEAYTVKAIYRLYNEGSSMEAIAESLNRARIPAKKGGAWNRQSICNVLHNPIYLGYIEWDGIVREGGHMAIIDKEAYEAVNGPFNG